MGITWPHLSQGVGLLSSALRHAGGVTQCKDDGSLVEGSHVLNELLSEGPGDGSSPYGCCGAQLTADVLQILHVLEFLGKHGFVFCDATTGAVLLQRHQNIMKTGVES